MLWQTDHLPLTFTPDADAGHHRVHGGSGLRAVQLQQHARRPHGNPHRALAACCRLTRSQVLQQGPKQAVVWGFGTPGANVTVSMTPQVGPVGFSVVDATGVWSAGIGPVAASEQAYVVTAVSGGETIMLQDVLFGDVWVSRGCCYAAINNINLLVYIHSCAADRATCSLLSTWASMQLPRSPLPPTSRSFVYLLPFVFLECDSRNVFISAL